PSTSCCARGSSPRLEPGSTRAGRASMTSATSTGCGAPFRTASRSTCARGSRACVAGPRSARSSSRGAGPTCARPASRGRGAASRGLGPQQLLQVPVLLGLEQLAPPAHEPVPDDDLREAHHPRLPGELQATLRILREVHFGELDAAGGQQPLRADAEGARICRVQDYGGVVGHYFIKYRKGCVSPAAPARAAPPSPASPARRGSRAS